MVHFVRLVAGLSLPLLVVVAVPLPTSTLGEYSPQVSQIRPNDGFIQKQSEESDTVATEEVNGQVEVVDIQIQKDNESKDNLAFQPSDNGDVEVHIGSKRAHVSPHEPEPGIGFEPGMTIYDGPKQEKPKKDEGFLDKVKDNLKSNIPVRRSVERVKPSFPAVPPGPVPEGAAPLRKKPEYKPLIHGLEHEQTAEHHVSEKKNFGPGQAANKLTKPHRVHQIARDQAWVAHPQSGIPTTNPCHGQLDNRKDVRQQGNHARCTGRGVTRQSLIAEPPPPAAPKSSPRDLSPQQKEAYHSGPPASDNQPNQLASGLDHTNPCFQAGRWNGDCLDAAYGKGWEKYAPWRADQLHPPASLVTRYNLPLDQDSETDRDHITSQGAGQAKAAVDTPYKDASTEARLTKSCDKKDYEACTMLKTGNGPPPEHDTPENVESSKDVTPRSSQSIDNETDWAHMCEECFEGDFVMCELKGAEDGDPWDPPRWVRRGCVPNTTPPPKTVEPSNSNKTALEKRDFFGHRVAQELTSGEVTVAESYEDNPGVEVEVRNDLRTVDKRMKFGDEVEPQPKPESAAKMSPTTAKEIETLAVATNPKIKDSTDIIDELEPLPKTVPPSQEDETEKYPHKVSPEQELADALHEQKEAEIKEIKLDKALKEQKEADIKEIKELNQDIKEVEHAMKKPMDSEPSQSPALKKTKPTPSKPTPLHSPNNALPPMGKRDSDFFHLDKDRHHHPGGSKKDEGGKGKGPGRKDGRPPPQ